MKERLQTPILIYTHCKPRAPTPVLSPPLTLPLSGAVSAPPRNPGNPFISLQ